MMQGGRERVRPAEFSVGREDVWSPVMQATAAGGCVVATGAYLGAQWLYTPVVAVPTGMWLVAAAGAGAWWLTTSGRTASFSMPTITGLGSPADADITPAEHEPERTDPAQLELFGGSIATPTSQRVLDDVDSARFELAPQPGPIGVSMTAAAKLVELATDALPWLTGSGVSAETVAGGERKVVDRLDAIRWPTRPVRIGCDVTADVRRALERAQGLTNVEWVRVDAGTDDNADCLRLGLDALVRQPTAGPLRISTPERTGRDAGWYDWSRPMPLSYAGVFPVRVDPAVFTIDDRDWIEHGEAELVRALADAAAILSRMPARLSLADRLAGRRAVLPVGDDVGGPADPLRGAIEGAMLRLTALVRAARGESRSSAAMRIAARVTGAWYASCDSVLDIRTRAAGVELAAEVLGTEVEAVLRVGAARVACGDEPGAERALVFAQRLVRESERPGPGGATFLQSEIELGGGDAMQIGRIAAGICMAYAAEPTERVGYLREDVLDDLRYAGWTLGREQDMALLDRVCRAMERARGSGTPAQRAA